uniref:ADP-ribosyl cyclase/cyclic ADP-ribose hydrolase n=1 Tax=Quercus lobata TaxID=97700 RepID=A0A7N2LFU1_QUELO
MASCFTTQTIQSSFSSPCFKPQPENDVFLNFRGEDTRINFTDHLYCALKDKKIITFKDDTKLEPGNPISLKLLDAIEKSRIAVVILSKNYASSTWCLEELVKILKCKKEGELTVFPILLWPLLNMKTVSRRRRPEGKFIQEIVEWIFTELKDKRSIVYEDCFIGIGSRVEEMNSFLDMNSNDNRFIGICGKSGMGKTTLASVVFDKIRNQFEAWSFLENVKEVSEACGLETLQEQLLCDISKGALRVRDVTKRIQVIRKILCDKKHLDKLKHVDFSDSQNLCQTPNFNGLPNIERLIFQGCTGLHALHPSVGGCKGQPPKASYFLGLIPTLSSIGTTLTLLYTYLTIDNLNQSSSVCKLQSLPYLPLCTQLVSAQGCTSLENYSNQVVVWTLDAARFTFINCHGLADDEEGKMADVPLHNMHFQSLWQRYIEDQIHQVKGFCLVVPQTKISEWFKNKECGPSVRIPLPPNLFNNRLWKGIALCVIFEVPENLKDVSTGQDSKYFHEFIRHFDMDGHFFNCPLVLKVPKETFVGSFGLWLYISHARFTEHSDEGSCIGSLIRPTRQDIQIKMCGARILYEQDMIEFVQENFRSCNDLSRDWARNHLYDYIFHQIARPSHWFNRNKLGPSIEMQLPPDVYDNSKWLGLTIHALYGNQMQPAGFSYKLDLTIFLRSSDEVSLAPYAVFPLSRDVSDESPQDSQRLVVFYIPRLVFQLNQYNHIGASFQSGDSAVQFESCGIRLVYEQNVAEFVQALVEYMLGSPDSNH